jgi:uncharacterized Tic20 family protein
MSMLSHPTSDERLLAALAHGSVLFSFFGPIGPVLVWILQRRKSDYASFHALQAMGFQVLFFWLWIIIGIISPLISLIVLVAGASALEGTDFSGMFPFIFQGAFLFMIFGAFGIYFLCGLIAAGFCAAGKDFRYPLFGNWLARYLSNTGDQQEGIDECREDTWVAAMCHAVAIIFTWGVALPAIVWLSQRKRSKRVSFHAIQALIYQGIATAVYFLGIAIYILFIFVMMTAMLFAGIAAPGGDAELPPWVGIVFSSVVIMGFLFWFVLIIAMPVYYILAGIGAMRTMKGHDFRYPLLGCVVARKLDYTVAA